MFAAPGTPRAADSGDWSDLDALVAAGDYWEMLLSSRCARSSNPLEELATELQCERRDNPFALLAELNLAIYTRFAYVPNSTNVDSPIEDALRTRQGVCQDFAHIMGRRLQIPCRYVSGYMFHRDEKKKTARWKARRMPGWRRWCRGWDGWRSIQRTILSERIGTFAWPLGAITQMFLQPVECTKARHRAR